MAKKVVVHLFKMDSPEDIENSNKVNECNGEPFVQPVIEVGDTAELCVACDVPRHRYPPPSKVRDK